MSQTNGGGSQTHETAANANTFTYRQRSAHRRIAMHHRFVRRRRWSKELDRLCRHERRCA